MSGLIAHAGKIWLAVDPVDMRRGSNRPALPSIFPAV